MMTASPDSEHKHSGGGIGQLVDDEHKYPSDVLVVDDEKKYPSDVLLALPISSPELEDVNLSVSYSDDDSHPSLVPLADQGSGPMVSLDDPESLFHAGRCGHFAELLGALKERPSLLDLRDHDGHSLLHWAALFNATHFIQACCVQVEDVVGFVNCRSSNGQTPFMWACIKGHLDTMKLLYREYGANINFSDSLKADAMILAVQHHQYNAVLLLHKWIGQVAPFSSRDAGGCTAVHWAAYKGDSLMLRLLHYLKADMNATDNQGMTPLHRASGEGWTDAAIFLRQHCGANPLLINNKNESCIDIAKRLSNKQLVIGLTLSMEELNEESHGGPWGSRWSLPMIFVAVLSATMISFFSDLFPDASMSLRIAFVCIAVVAIHTYSDLVVTDPGFIPKRSPGKSAIEELQEKLDASSLSQISPDMSVNKICITCWEFKDIERRSKHCAVCDRCVDSFDHHCAWINNCVAESNHREFVIMVFSVWAGMVLFMYISISQSIHHPASFMDFLWGKPLLIPLWLVHALVIPWLSILLGSQFRSIAINMNTNELMNMHRYAHFWEGPLNVFAQPAAPETDHVHGEHCRHSSHPGKPPQRRFKNPFDKGGVVANCMHFWLRRKGNRYQRLDEIEMAAVV